MYGANWSGRVSRQCMRLVKSQQYPLVRSPLLLRSFSWGSIISSFLPLNTLGKSETYPAYVKIHLIRYTGMGESKFYIHTDNMKKFTSYQQEVNLVILYHPRSLEYQQKYYKSLFFVLTFKNVGIVHSIIHIQFTRTDTSIHLLWGKGLRISFQCSN